jgi:sugar phosphate permease
VQKLVLSYAGYCLVAALFVWLFVPESDSKAMQTQDRGRQIPLWMRLAIVLRSPVIWLQAIIIIAAYSAFKMLDNYGLYAEDAYGLSKTQSANLVANVSYIRVASALAAGWVADRLLGVRATIQCCFALLLLAYAGFLLVVPSTELVWLLTANIAISCIGFFSLRGIYFALLEDSGISRRLTGTAVGIISFVGYTPEIYMGPLTGWLIREARADGNVLSGYRRIFVILAGLCICGMLATFALRWFRRKQPEAVQQAS